MKNNYIKSCISYTGGKYKLLPQIIPLFPNKNINTFYEVFTGGCNIAPNITADNYVCCDILEPVMSMFNYVLSFESVNDFITEIEKVIRIFNLSKINSEGYLKLRELYNNTQNNDYNKNLLLYVLICYSFNNQIRFNSKGEYNMPFGKNRSSFNNNLKANLIKWFADLKKKDIIFKAQDFNKTFEEILSKANVNDFIYLDPPYLAGSIATYNENNGWNEKTELLLLNWLTTINKEKIPFALSNVFIHKGETNELLVNWSKDYNVHYLNYNYQNCSYHKKNKNEETVEVLITNY